MNELFEKEPSKSYFDSEAKSYEIEKANQRKYTHIDLGNNTKEIAVDDDIIKLLIEEYEKDSTCDFRALYKVYKLQNYQVDPKYYQGTRYTESTLISSKVVVRRALSGKEIPQSQYKIHKKLIDFSRDLQDLDIKPYPVVGKNNRITNLLQSSLLTEKDINFIKSPTYKIFEVPKSNTINSKIARGGVRCDESFYNLLVLNYKTDLDNLCRLLPNFSKTTLYMYKRMCEKLEYKEDKEYFPKGLVKAFKKIYRPNELPPVVKDKEEKTTINTANTKVEDKSEKIVQLNEKESSNNRYAYTVAHNNDIQFKFIDFNNNEDFIKGYMKGLNDIYKEKDPNVEIKLLKITEVNY